MNDINMLGLKRTTDNAMLWGMNLDNANGFVASLISGSITGYSNIQTDPLGFVKSSFLQNDSDYITNWIYYPVLIEPFFDTAVFTHFFIIGSQQVSEVIADSIKALDSCKAVKIFENLQATKPHNSFLDYEPYTTYTLYVPFFETISIPAVYMYDKIDGYLAIDFTNGHATLYITDTNGYVLITKETTIGIQLPIGSGNGQEQQRNKILQAISIIGAGAGAVIGGATGNPIALTGAVAMGTNIVKQALQNNVDTYSGRGGSGNKDSLVTDLRIILFCETVDNTFYPVGNIVGRPCNKTISALSYLSGYTEVGTIHFDPKGYDIYNDEINEIVTLLHNGVVL